jgi:predicted dehydrogenase
VGLGNVGCAYDFNRADLVTTHARAYTEHPAFNLVGAVDSSQERRDHYSQQYTGKTCATVDELFKQQRIDIVSLCVPTEYHFDLFKHVLEYDVPIILCEKPLASTLEEAEAMLSLAADKKTVVAVNYMRRFLPETKELKALIDSQPLGDFEQGLVVYSGGIFNSASHFVDLLTCFFGAPSQSLCQKNYGGQDPECDFELLWQKASQASAISFRSHRSKHYANNEFELFFSEGSIRYVGGGQRIEIRRKQENPLFEGYACLNFEGEEIKTNLGRYQYYVLDELYRSYITGTVPISNAESAMQTLKIVSAIKCQ